MYPILKTAGIAILAMAMAGTARAGDIKPAIMFDLAGRFDDGFNQRVGDGALRFREETGIGFAESAAADSEGEFEKGHRFLAGQHHSPIIAAGFAQASTVAKVAKDFPKTRWIMIDGIVDLPNVQSVAYKEQEGSFLVGIAAAMAAKSGKIGFIGGMDSPLTRRFACGYEQGAKYVRPKIEVVEEMIGKTPWAWSDPVRANEMAKSQFRHGVDVIYAAAYGSGLGVYQAAYDSKKLAISSDSDVGNSYRGTMLAVMVKHVETAAYDGLMAAKNGTWKPGVTVLGLKEGGVDWAPGRFSGKLITPAMKAKILAAKADIIAGKIKVADYMADNKCSY